MIYANENKVVSNNYDWVEFDISPQQIREMCDYFSRFYIMNESYLHEAKSPDDILDEIGDHLLKFFDDGAEVADIVVETADHISRVIRQRGLNKTSMEIIDDVMSKAFVDMTNSFNVRDAAFLKFKYYDANDIRKSMKLLLYVYIINSIFSMVLVMLLGPLGNWLGAVIVAPIVEESAKRIAITGKFGKEFAVVFNAFEFAMYVTRFDSVDKIIAIRGICVGMHLITFIINWISQNTKLLKMLHLDREKDEKQVSNIGYILGIFIHSLWNGGLSDVIVGGLLS